MASIIATYRSVIYGFVDGSLPPGGLGLFHAYGADGGAGTLAATGSSPASHRFGEEVSRVAPVWGSRSSPPRMLRFAQTLEAVRAQEVDVPVDLRVDSLCDDTVALARQFGRGCCSTPGERRAHELGHRPCAGVRPLVQDAIPADRRWLTALGRPGDHPARRIYLRTAARGGRLWSAGAEYGTARRRPACRSSSGRFAPAARGEAGPLQFNNVSSMVRRGVWQGCPFRRCPCRDLPVCGAARRAHGGLCAESVVRHSHERAFYEFAAPMRPARSGTCSGVGAALTVAQAEGLPAAQRLTVNESRRGSRGRAAGVPGDVWPGT